MTGYASRLSAEPGTPLTVHAGAWPAAAVRARVLRLQHDGPIDVGPELRAVPLGVELGTAAAEPRATAAGSCAVARPPEPLRFTAGVTIVLWVQMQRPRGGQHVLFSAMGASTRIGLSLGVDPAGRPFWEAGGRITGLPLRAGAWHLLAASVDVRTGALRLHERCLDPLRRWSHTVEAAAVALETDSLAQLALASDVRETPPSGRFTGKLAQPVLLARPLDVDGMRELDDLLPPRGDCLAAWDFVDEAAAPVAADRIGAADFDLLQAPTRAVTGPAWESHVTDHRAHPESYAAIHFAADQVDDAGWPATFMWDLPPDLTSGLYFVELTADADRDLVPVFVAAPGGSAGVTVLASTFTYLAYANERLGRGMVEPLPGWSPPMDAHDEVLARHPEWGRSLYDTHDDGTAVSQSSHLRPVPNLRPDYRCWFVDGPRHLGADARLLQWLQREEVAFDLVTDHSLHQHGHAVLDAADVLLTASHPEYVSDRTMTALERHQRDGGRLMYLGGNGFYWVTGVPSVAPHRVEVRRGPKGTTSWESQAAEQRLASTGEPGGLWRHRQRPPNALTGIGFTAQGWDGHARAYRRRQASRSPRWRWVFEGVDDEALIGGSGGCMGGAAGDEIDRADAARGTPPETVVLATADGFSDAYQLVVEDVPEMRADTGGTTSDLVRADMAITARGSEGAVFAVGSIAWIAALDVDDAVATVTRNVLRRFRRA